MRRDLIRLFGLATWRRAGRLHPEQVDASAVHDAAGALLSLKGNQAAQASMVRNMNPETAAALCRWLAEPGFWGVVAGVTTH